MADQWSRKIWETLTEGSTNIGSNTSDLKEAAYDRRDENGAEVPGTPGDIPPPETSFHQKTHDNILHIKSTLDLFAPGAYASIGHVPGIIPKTVNSSNSGIRTGTTPEDVWRGGNPYNGLANITPFTPNINSVDSKDTSIGGVGAREILIKGLDSNFNFQSETILLDGVTPVPSTLQWIRVEYASVTIVGSENDNAGSIFIRDGATVYVVIRAGENTGGFLGFTVPAGKSVLLIDYNVINANEDDITLADTGFSDVRLSHLNFGEDVYTPIHSVYATRNISSTRLKLTGFLIREKTSVIARIFSSSPPDSAVDTKISGFINYLEIDNELINTDSAKYFPF